VVPLVLAHPVIATGLATFVFGFGAGAALNLYLISVKSPLIAEHRGSLNYVSSIVGDGVLLPLMNMVIVSFLIAHRVRIDSTTLTIAVSLGVAVTVYFHVVQAVRGLVNWTMPRPWRWNALGAFHAAYMLAAASLLALFYSVVGAGALAHDGGIGPSATFVTAGVVCFCALLRLDYAAVSLRALAPSRIPRHFVRRARGDA
jgi:hypothetical protein